LKNKFSLKVTEGGACVMSKGEESAGTVRATFHNDLTHDESIQHRAKLPWDRLSNFWNFRQGARPGLKMWLITFAVKKDATAPLSGDHRDPRIHIEHRLRNYLESTSFILVQKKMNLVPLQNQVI
jgi:hypothetical protein